MTEKRMKILHVLTDRNIGGAGRWLLYYLKYHNREKFAVKVVLPHDSLLVAAVQALDVPVLAMEEMEDKSFDRKAFKALAKIFRAERPDIVHTHAGKKGESAVYLQYKALHGGRAGRTGKEDFPQRNQCGVQ